MKNEFVKAALEKLRNIELNKLKQKYQQTKPQKVENKIVIQKTVPQKEDVV